MAKPDKVTAKPKSDDEDDDLDALPVDITLNEAERILIDYASLLNNGKGVALTRPGQNVGNSVQPKGGAVAR